MATRAAAANRELCECEQIEQHERKSVAKSCKCRGASRTEPMNPLPEAPPPVVVVEMSGKPQAASGSVFLGTTERD